MVKHQQWLCFLMVATALAGPTAEKNDDFLSEELPASLQPHSLTSSTHRYNIHLPHAKSSLLGMWAREQDQLHRDRGSLQALSNVDTHQFAQFEQQQVGERIGRDIRKLSDEAKEIDIIVQDGVATGVSYRGYNMPLPKIPNIDLAISNLRGSVDFEVKGPLKLSAPQMKMAAATPTALSLELMPNDKSWSLMDKERQTSMAAKVSMALLVGCAVLVALAAFQFVARQKYNLGLLLVILAAMLAVDVWFMWQMPWLNAPFFEVSTMTTETPQAETEAPVTDVNSADMQQSMANNAEPPSLSGQPAQAPPASNAPAATHNHQQQEKALGASDENAQNLQQEEAKTALAPDCAVADPAWWHISTWLRSTPTREDMCKQQPSCEWQPSNHKGLRCQLRGSSMVLEKDVLATARHLEEFMNIYA